jgi:antagonist of KipI
VAPVLGSLSTYLRAGLGGLHGRALQAGDVLPGAGPTAAGQKLLQQLAARDALVNWQQAGWTPPPDLCPRPRQRPIIRAIRGPEYEQFSVESLQAFWQHPYTVTTEADRMGYRLQGRALTRQTDVELLSSAVTFGTVQVPAKGQPIVLMADHQTTGGYPRIAQVITADFSALAQLAPGQAIRFQEVTLAEAQSLYLAQERRLLQLQRSVALKVS